jgi:hypothetical protein
MTDDTLSPALATTLRRLCEQVEIVSPERLVFAGSPQDVAARPAAGEPAAPNATAQPLVLLLRDLLYQHAYTHRFDAPPTAAPAAAADFALRLSQGNRSRDQWLDGWNVLQALDDGCVLAQRFDAQRMLWPGEYVVLDATVRTPAQGVPLRIFQPRESRTLQAGFYFAFGESLAEGLDESRLLRTYWNVTAEGAILLVERITSRLNRLGIPFRFKCGDAPERFGRLDAAVLYTHRRYHRILRLQIDQLLAGFDERHIGRDTPLFTWPLRPGVSIAEDPPGGESFGMHRCRILAEGMWNAFVEKRAAAQERLDRVCQHLADCGMSLRAMHLNPGSRFDYS